MGIFSKYIKGANLDNRTTHPYKSEIEGNMPVNKKKIRREITLNGAKVWVTADTEQEYADKIARLCGASPARSSKHRFDNYADRWYEHVSKPNVAEVTARTYKRQIDHHINPVLGKMNVEDISSIDVQEIFNRMDDNAKQETKNKVKNVLNQIFKMAAEEDLIQKNPMQAKSLKIKGIASTCTEPYSVSDMRYFAMHLNDIEDPYERAWLALSIALPLRPEEVLGLRWCNVDEQNSVLYVRSSVTHPTRNQGVYHEYGKTEASRRDLAIPRGLLQYLPERGRPLDFVVSGCSPLSYSRLRKIRLRIAEQIGYGGLITPRRFRTTVATDISAETHDLKLVQHMLGHATPQMTLKHYDKGRSTTVDASTAIERCYGI